MHKPKTKLGLLKTTGIGGVLFLLPLIILGALVGQIVPIVWTVTEFLANVIPVPIKTPVGISLLVGAAILLLLLIWYIAGIIARRSFGRRISATFEKNLAMLFPRYSVIKDQLAGTLAGDKDHPAMQPVMVRLIDSSRIAFEVDRSDRGFVTLFLPGSPDPWSGQLLIVKAEQVQPIDLKFQETLSIFETLGRDSMALYEANLMDGEQTD